MRTARTTSATSRRHTPRRRRRRLRLHHRPHPRRLRLRHLPRRRHHRRPGPGTITAEALAGRRGAHSRCGRTLRRRRRAVPRAPCKRRAWDSSGGGRKRSASCTAARSRTCRRRASKVQSVSSSSLFRRRLQRLRLRRRLRRPRFSGLAPCSRAATRSICKLRSSFAITWWRTSLNAFAHTSAAPPSPTGPRRFGGANTSRAMRTPRTSAPWG